jgi:starch synthase (maltosyl-transferring)
MEEMVALTGRLGIDDVSPSVGCGRWPAKAVVGEHVPVSAAIWRDGHDKVAATVTWRGPHDRVSRQTRMVDQGPGLDLFAAVIVPDEPGAWTYRVDAWSDPWGTFTHAAEVKIEAGQGPGELANDLETGARLIDRVSRRPDRWTDRAVLISAAKTLRDDTLPLDERVTPALSDEVARIMHKYPVRELVTKGQQMRMWVDRTRAAFGSWYEFFPRSTGGFDEAGRPVHGTFATATAELDRIAAMGFDVAYLPPIHPIGRVNRKAPNNKLGAKETDVGSPWAIGADEGGHEAIHPQLGTIEDFDRFVERAEELGLEVALDLAFQAAPDHPWVSKYPDFFTIQPDGTIAYAENPPKKYQDIYPMNFDNDAKGIYGELLRIVLHWIEHGVRIFRVDNPHTKPPNFWAWLIQTVKDSHPDVLFLSEAFTRPAILWGLARLGFTQSYTYFTWRTTKEQLIEFGIDLVDHCDEGRPNLFVNTPDILHQSLQVGGPGMFALRAAIAATMSPSWGVYSGYELYEHEPVRPGSEEYLNSEKYQLRPRDFAGALAQGRSLEPWLTRLNEIRRAHPALQQLRSLRFHFVDSAALIAYSKQDPATGDTVVVVVNLDPREAQSGMLWLDLPELGFEWYDRLIAHDDVSGETWDWGQANWVRLEPWRNVAHIVSIRPRLSTSS